MNHIVLDRTRTATLWMKDRTTFIDIPEEDWPPATHGDDRQAAHNWAQLTGLTVTIKTELVTTHEPNT
tara:strand:+ start:774 stop:977 length:204 start_codon:yes stop_codon:yes gene_type:complete